jgi:protein-tyrosine phosphatase
MPRRTGRPHPPDRLVIDTHCHLLPGLDDGPRSHEESLRLARALVEDGITRVLCTPHYSGMFPTVHAEAEERHRELRALLDSQDVPLQTSLAAEVGPAAAAARPIRELSERSISGRYILVEVLPDSVAAALHAVSERLQVHDLRPIFGHPEQCRALHRHPMLLDGLRAEGALVQVVAPSLLGRWGPEVEAASWRLVDTGRTDLLASDAHGARRRRPHLGEVAALVAERLGDSVAEELTVRKPQLVLDGGLDTSP